MVESGDQDPVFPPAGQDTTKNEIKNLIEDALKGRRFLKKLIRRTQEQKKNTIFLNLVDLSNFQKIILHLICTLHTYYEFNL